MLTPDQVFSVCAERIEGPILWLCPDDFVPRESQTVDWSRCIDGSAVGAIDVEAALGANAALGYVYPSTSRQSQDPQLFHRLSTVLSQAANLAVSQGKRIVSIDETFFARGLPGELHAQGATHVVTGAVLNGHPVLKHYGLTLPVGADCEIECPDLTSAITQFPCGEAFLHFDCTWSARDVLLAFVEPWGWEFARVVLREGCVVSVCDTRHTALIGRNIVEVGVGLNDSVPLRPVPWAEKASGVVHVGFGGRLAGDTAHSGVHFDAVLACDESDLSTTRASKWQ